jgi:hypothetical protein
MTTLRELLRALERDGAQALPFEDLLSLVGPVLRTGRDLAGTESVGAYALAIQELSAGGSCTGT